MSDFWIVSAHKFARHGSLEKAEKERGRLAAKLPGQQFRVYRCKGALKRTGSFDALVSALIEARNIVTYSRSNGIIAECRHCTGGAVLIESGRSIPHTDDCPIMKIDAAIALAASTSDPYIGATINGETFNDTGAPVEHFGDGIAEDQVM